MSFLGHSTPFSYPSATASLGTAIVQGVPPFMGNRGVPFLYGLDAGGAPNWTKNPHNTVISNIGVGASSTIHTIYCLRPLNYTTVAVAGAINSTSFTLAANPGTYSTNYKYSLGGGKSAPAGVADLTPTTTHYYATQLADGTWFFDLIAGFNTSTLVVTTTATIPNVTGGGVPKGAIFFLLGSGSTKDPATGMLPPSYLPPTASTATQPGLTTGVFSTFHPGDPMLLLDANGTAADTITNVGGYYVKAI